MNYCKSCETNKAQTEFYKSSKNKCKACYIAKVQTYRKKIRQEGTGEEVDPTKLKKCNICLHEKAIINFDFALNSKSPNLRRGNCKACRKSRNRAYYLKTHMNLRRVEKDPNKADLKLSPEPDNIVQ